MDSSFHSPEWHAARLASLKTSHTVTWEEYKRKQKVIYATLYYLLPSRKSFEGFPEMILLTPQFCHLNNLDILKHYCNFMGNEQVRTNIIRVTGN